MIIECLKQGAGLTNKNLPLVFIRILLTIINIISLFIFLGIPILIAVAYLGFDWVHAKELIPYFTENPMSFISRYIGLVFLFGSALMFYLAFSSLLFLYALGGTLGSLKNSAMSVQHRFSLSSFFQEANTNFFKLLWLLSLILIIITVLSVFLIILGGIVAALFQTLGSGDMLQTFLNSFIAIFIGILGLTIAFAGFVIGVYSVILSVVDGLGSVDALGGAYTFIKQHPHALLFMLVLVIIVLFVSALFYGLQVPFHLIPFVGEFMNIPIYLVSAFFQSYLAIFVWGSLIAYYIRSSQYPADQSDYEI